MKYFLLMLNVVGLVLLSGCHHEELTHTGPVNILVMGEDADRQSLRRDSAAFNRVLKGLVGQLSSSGHNVYDETALSLDNFAQGRVRRSEAELIDIARSVRRPPMDVAVLFSIYPTAVSKSYTTKVNVRVEGKMLNAQSGQNLGDFELEFPNAWNVAPSCNRTCLENSIGDNAAILAKDVGAALADKLRDLKGEPVAREPSYDSGNAKAKGLLTGYKLVFKGYTAEEVHKMESYMEFFSGYRSHRIVSMGDTRAEYWYSSTIGTAELHRNLIKLLDRTNMKGTVRAAGNDFTVSRVSLRGEKRIIDPSEW